MSNFRELSRSTAIAAGVVLLSLLSCGRELTAPGDDVRLSQRGMFAFEPLFPKVMNASAASLVSFERVRILLHRADGSVALDTTISFPAGADSVALAADVKLAPLTGNKGESFQLDLGYLNTAGEVVFKGGPVDLVVMPKGSQASSPPVQIPVRYSGPGAAAVHVVIAPKQTTLTENQSFTFTAVATDAAGNTIPNTPIVWGTLDPSKVALQSTSAGAVKALPQRGDARVVAQLLTGPVDSAIVHVLLAAKNLAMQSGDEQTGAVSMPLSQPLTVRVTAVDGVPVAGATVNFAVNSGGGALTSTSSVTGAAGLASTTWTLGPSAGQQSVSAAAVGLSGSPVSFRATGVSVAPVKLMFTAVPPASNPAGSPLSPLTVTAYDAQDAVAKTFDGTVTIALTSGSSSAPLLGTLIATAVEGVATFPDVRINVPNTGYLLSAASPGLSAATTTAFSVVPGPAKVLEFGAYPVFGAVAGPLAPVSVIARDVAGNVATSYAGLVSIALVTDPTNSLLTGTRQVKAVAGVAQFDQLSLTLAGEYQLGGSADGLGAAKGPSFPLRAGPPALLVAASGTGQSATTGSAVLRPIVIGLADRYRNRAVKSGVSVSFSASAGGSVSPSSGITDVSGQIATVWTLGGALGVQSLTASSAGLTSVVVTALATGAAAGTMAVYAGNNQFAVANTSVLTPPSVILKNGAGQALSGVAVTFTPSAGSSVTGASTIVTGANGVAAVGGWTLGASGSFTLTASASGYTSVVFTGTVNTVPMSVVSAEKLPNGTQQFSVTGGNSGDTYTWTVNGIVGGNSIFGTITNTGYYTAPGTVPTPATFAVCAQSVQTPSNKGCINVTINSVPTAGGELIVINDVNWADNYYGLGQSGGVFVNPGSAQLVRNLVGFTPSGVRASATKVLMLDDRYSGYSFSTSWSTVASIITAQGYTPYETSSHADLVNIAADVKLVILQVPGTTFSVSEINGLKTFASQGGRILFTGENGGYYSYGLAIEDAFLASMGAKMTNTGACDAPGVYVNSVAHQLTTGIAASGSGGVYMNCVSHINLGPNDFALMTDAYGNVVAGIAKIDYTLLPMAALVAPQDVHLSRSVRSPVGLPGWSTTGPTVARP